MKKSSNSLGKGAMKDLLLDMKTKGEQAKALGQQA